MKKPTKETLGINLLGHLSDETQKGNPAQSQIPF